VDGDVVRKVNVSGSSQVPVQTVASDSAANGYFGAGGAVLPSSTSHLVLLAQAADVDADHSFTKAFGALS